MEYALQVFDNGAFIHFSTYVRQPVKAVRYDLSDLAGTIPQIIRDILSTPNVCATTAQENVIWIDRLDDEFSWTRMAHEIAVKMNRRFSPYELVSPIPLEQIR
jgi:hypothetical protein